MQISLVHLTYSKMCDLLKPYTDADLASLIRKLPLLSSMGYTKPPPNQYNIINYLLYIGIN